MIERFQGTNRPALVNNLLLQRFVQNRKEIAEDLIAAGELIEFASGDTLIVQDESNDDVFLIVAGTVAVTANGVEVRTLDTGAHVGEMSAIDSANPRSATVIASGNVVALKVPAAKFVEICDKHEGTWKFIARAVQPAIRLQQTHQASQRKPKALHHFVRGSAACRAGNLIRIATRLLACGLDRGRVLGEQLCPRNP